MERQTPADKLRFLDYARSSSAEFRTQAIIGVKAGILLPELGSRRITIAELKTDDYISDAPFNRQP